MSRQPAPKLLALATIAGFGVALGCAIAGGELLSLVERPNGSTSFDSSITSWLVAHRSHGLTTLARVFSTLGSQVVLLPVTAIVTVGLLARRRFAQAGMLVAAWGGAVCLYTLTKDSVDRMRPPSAIWLTDVGRTSSFPSGHATQSLATLIALALVSASVLPGARYLGRVLSLILVLGIGWSRVYLGVHWATDVGAGWLIAAAWTALLVWLIAPERARSPRITCIG